MFIRLTFFNKRGGRGEFMVILVTLNNYCCLIISKLEILNMKDLFCSHMFDICYIYILMVCVDGQSKIQIFCFSLTTKNISHIHLVLKSTGPRRRLGIYIYYCFCYWCSPSHCLAHLCFVNENMFFYASITSSWVCGTLSVYIWKYCHPKWLKSV